MSSQAASTMPTALTNNGQKAIAVRQLFFGDNLDILPQLPDESIDLIYLDPPFNSKQTYNVLFKEKDHRPSSAQIEAFDDTWHWTPETQRQFEKLLTGQNVPPGVSTAISALRLILGENDVLAYLVMMAPRLLELHRVLKSTGSLYLHCDPTSSHYLKILLDAVFDPRLFRGEITWQRTNVHNDAKRWSPVADNLLYYGKSDHVTWNPPRMPHSEKHLASKYRNVDQDGRRFTLSDMTSPSPRVNMMYDWKGFASPPLGWRYSKATMEQLDLEGRIWYPTSKDKRPRLKRFLDEMAGVVLGNVWTDIDPLNSQASERLGYPTQKPVALLERIIRASSNGGDLVLDPFCGCGTAVDAAEKLGRSWIGIDIAFVAITVIEDRLQKEHPGIGYDLQGVPRDMGGAESLLRTSHKNFEMWAVRQAGGRPNPKGGGDDGTDGVIPFYLDGKTWGTVTISVKGGDNVNPAMVSQLVGTVQSDQTQLGLLITRVNPTKGMKELAAKQGSYVWPVTGQRFPKFQIVSVQQLLGGARIDVPPVQVQGALFGAPKELVPSAPSARRPKVRKADKTAAEPVKVRRRQTRRPVETPAAETAIVAGPGETGAPVESPVSEPAARTA
jgi:site-specific DNA-methyltransferase (adenine-specific)